MAITAIVGANYGDEGKGRMVDALADSFGWVVRFQGGANAGHTVINRWGKFALHQLPAGVFHPELTNVIGPGVALDLEVLERELDELSARAVPAPGLLISERVELVLPSHRLLDALEEERLGARQFGSTRSGIAPFYADKARKLGLKLDDLFDETLALERVEALLSFHNHLLTTRYEKPAIDAKRLLGELLARFDTLRPFVADTSETLHRALKRGEAILLEGQLGALRDPDHGIHPYVTSSSPLAGFATVGAGVPARAIERVIAVTKAYSTAVGAGPFVTELGGEAEQTLRERGGDAGEYGATTGRPRRVGWFDGPATRYGCRLQGATELALTGLDVLGYLDEIPLCHGYRLDGEALDTFPTTRRLERVRPVYERMPGWKQPLGNVRTMADLPSEARRYLARIEELADVRLSFVSVGPEREALIEC